MINIVTDWKEEKIPFDGEVITCEVRPLRTDAYMKLLPLFADANPRKKGESIADYLKRITPEEADRQRKNAVQMQRLAPEIFPAHVRNLRGLSINGVVPPDEELFAEMADIPQLMSLAVSLCALLVNATELPRGEEKNSGSPSECPGGEATGALPGGRPGGGSPCSTSATNGAQTEGGTPEKQRAVS